MSIATQQHDGDIAYFTSAEELAKITAGNRSEGTTIAAAIASQRRKRGATSQSDLLWPNGIIYYSFSSQFTGILVRFFD